MFLRTSRIADDEKLARFILFSKLFRRSDQAVKPDAFIPHPHEELSVTRHRKLSDKKLWDIGKSVARKRPSNLYGRADIQALQARKQNIDVVPRPLWKNRNHACLVGWPVEKEKQKIIAIEIAASANFVPVDS